MEGFSLEKIKVYFEEYKFDIAKFIFYTAFFSYLLFAVQSVYSPAGQSVFNSAYDGDRRAADDASTADDQTFDIGQKIIKRPLLSISFNPDGAKADDLLLKAVKFNAESKYFKEKVTPLDIRFDATRVDPRGQVSGSNLILSLNINDLSESMKVFVHELGHIIDLHYLTDMGNYDPSYNFYNISWASYNVKKRGAKMNDFLTGYALTNKYEDFAESFGFYIFHNEEFKRRGQKNLMIARKYNFFKKYVFVDSGFQSTSFEDSSIPSYNWDSTKIKINLKKYLYYIR